MHERQTKSNAAKKTVETNIPQCARNHKPFWYHWWTWSRPASTGWPLLVSAGGCRTPSCRLDGQKWVYSAKVGSHQLRCPARKCLFKECRIGNGCYVARLSYIRPVWPPRFAGSAITQNSVELASATNRRLALCWHRLVPEIILRRWLWRKGKRAA